MTAHSFLHHPIHINTPSISAAATNTTSTSRTKRHDIQIFPNSARPKSPDKAAVLVTAPVPTGATGAAVEISSRAKEPEASAGSAVTASGRLAMGSSRPAIGRSVAATSELMDATAGRDRQPFLAGACTSADVSGGLMPVGGIPTPATRFSFATLHRSVAETAATALCPEGFTSVAAASIRARAKAVLQ